MKTVLNLKYYMILLCISIVSVIILVNSRNTVQVWESETVHSTIVAFGIVGAFLLSVLMIMRFLRNHESWQMWIATGLTGMGILEGFHSMVPPGQGFVFLHSASILVGGFYFSLVWLSKKENATLFYKRIFFLNIVAVLLLSITAAGFRGVFPVMIVDGEFTAFAISINLLAGFLFFMASVKFIRLLQKTNRKEFFYFSAASLLFAFSAISFNYAEMWDFTWWMFHFLRLGAYIILTILVLIEFNNNINLLSKVVLEKEESEKQLVQSYDTLRLILDSMPFGVFIVGMDKKVRQANLTAVKLSGYESEEELKGTLCHNTLCPADVDNCPILNLNLKVDNSEKIFRSRDGRETPILKSVVPLVIRNEEVLLETFIDISELKKAETELRLERKQLLALFDGIDEVIYVSDPETYELVWVNNAFKKNWGGQIAGKKCYEVLQDRDNPCPFCTNKHIFGENEGKTWYWEFQNEITHRWYRCADKAIRWSDGRMVRFELAYDISVQKVAEQELKEKLTELERSNHELEQFAYVASHDLQEPLRMVSSFTQLLAKRYEHKLDEEAHEFINYAVDGAIRMQKLLNDLLDYSRVTTRGKELVSLDATAVLGNAISLLYNQITETGALVTNTDLPLVMADDTQLMRVFQNLIGNAIKFRSQERPHVHISCQLVGDFWKFSVKDNGIGIEPKYKDLVFQIFKTLHNKSEYAGTGIGLAICKRIINRHGGEIWFESLPNEGCTFFFTLRK